MDGADSVTVVDVAEERRADEVVSATAADAVDHEEDSAVEVAVDSQEVEAAAASREVVAEAVGVDGEATRRTHEKLLLFVRAWSSAWRLKGPPRRNVHSSFTSMTSRYHDHLATAFGGYYGLM